MFRKNTSTVSHTQQSTGFTIVELVIVVIVIGIIAGITIISYGAVTKNAAEQTLQADLKTATSKLSRYKADHGSYPTSLDAVTIDGTSTTDFDYTYLPVIDGYCLSGTHKDISYHMASDNTQAQEDPCPANIIANSYDTAVKTDLIEINRRVETYKANNGAYPTNDSTFTVAMNSYRIAGEAYTVDSSVLRNLTFCRNAGNTTSALGALSKSGTTWVILNNSEPYEFTAGYFSDTNSPTWCQLVSPSSNFSSAYNGYASPAWRTWTGAS